MEEQKNGIISSRTQILIAAYFILKDKVPYKELGEVYLSNFRKRQAGRIL